MSLKNIELQIAVPRTVENSRNQQILQQQTTLQNEMDSDQLKSRTEQAEQTVAETHQNERTAIRDRQKQGKREEQADRGQVSGHESDEQTQSSIHPYMGHKLDIKM